MASTTRTKKKTARGGRSKRRAVSDGLDLGSDKVFFKIGEVAEIVGVAAHVLRYWENEFKTIRPQKSKSQQRVYRRRDVETLLKIKHLLYGEKYTIAGAKQRIEESRDEVPTAEPDLRYRARRSLAQVSQRLSDLRVLVHGDVDPRSADPAEYVRLRGGGRGLYESTTETPPATRPGEEAPQGPSQPLLERPGRDAHPGR
jgi:DNA-binding transcriptional MerR regulator